MADDDKFQSWMRSQIRLAGEELIRRSESLTLDGLDLIHEVDIRIVIPTYSSEITFQSMKISFAITNKKHLDVICSGGDSYVGSACCESRHDYLKHKRRDDGNN